MAPSRETPLVLIVEDEASFREVLQMGLEPQGFRTLAVGTLAEAQALLGKPNGSNGNIRAVVSDLRLKDGSGIDLLTWMKEKGLETPVVIMTAFATTETTVNALNLGAADFLTKTKNDLGELSKVLRGLFAESEPRLHEEGAEIGDLVGVGEIIRKVQAMVGKFARADSTVLLTGESGTGKEVVARLIHRYSERSKGPFIAVNCGALPDELLESELFGFEKGAFTGASAVKKGLFEEAQNGILFLDKIGEMPLHLQVKLLRALQERKVRRIGSSDERVVDVRVIVATNRNLKERMEKRWFREDLYYRLNILHIDLPPLRDRQEDLPVLVTHFLTKFCAKLKKPPIQMRGDAMELMQRYDFPGNVRELENLIERCVALTSGSVITLDVFPDGLLNAVNNPQVLKGLKREDMCIPGDGFDLEGYLTSLRGFFLLQALEQAGNNKTKASKRLGMSFRAYRYWLQQLGGAEALPSELPWPVKFPASAQEDPEGPEL